MGKTKKAPAEGTTEVSANGHSHRIGGEVKRIKLSSIVSNTAQSRGMGVMANLKDQGYGVFEKIVPENEAIWNLLWSEKIEDRKKGCDLIQEHEKALWRFAESLSVDGVLQDVGVEEIIGVDGQPSGTYDVMWGMRRILALTINYVKDSINEPDDVSARVVPGGMDEVQKRFLAMKENEDREDESPIEVAMNYQWLEKKKGLTPKAIGDGIGRSDQHVRDYLKLLHKRLEKERMKIHTRQMSVDAALKLYKKRGQNPEAEAEDKTGDKERVGPPKAKTLSKWYDMGGKPDACSEKEWILFQSADVRELLSIWLNKPFTTFEEVVEKAEEDARKAAEALQAKMAAQAEEDEKNKTLVITRERAKLLLVCLGKTNAHTFSDDVLKEKLENIPAQCDNGEDTIIEDPGFQKLLGKVWEAYKTDLKVTIKIPSPKKVEAK